MPRNARHSDCAPGIAMAFARNVWVNEAIRLTFQPKAIIRQTGCHQGHLALSKLHRQHCVVAVEREPWNFE